MIKKIIARIKGMFTPSKIEENCEHANRISRTVKYCSECKLVLDES